MTTRATRFYQAKSRVAAGDEITGAIINLDHVIAVDRRPDGALRVIMTTPGVSFEIMPEAEREFLAALTRWWSLLDRIVDQRVLPTSEENADQIEAGKPKEGE